jgi:hypothetical protein
VAVAVTFKVVHDCEQRNTYIHAGIVITGIGRFLRPECQAIWQEFLWEIFSTPPAFDWAAVLNRDGKQDQREDQAGMKPPMAGPGAFFVNDPERDSRDEADLDPHHVLADLSLQPHDLPGGFQAVSDSMI